MNDLNNHGDVGENVTVVQELPGQISVAHQPGMVVPPREVSLKAFTRKSCSGSETKTRFLLGLVSVQFHRLHLIETRPPATPTGPGPPSRRINT